MYSKQLYPEASEQGGSSESTPNVDDVKAENAASDEQNVETTDPPSDSPSESEDDFFGGFSTADSNAAIDAAQQPATTETIPVAEYNKLKSELNAANEKINSLTALIDNPMVQVAMQYAELKKGGVDVSPEDFVNYSFGTDVTRMSDDEVIRESIMSDAKSLGLTLSEEDLADEYEQRLNEIQSKGTIARNAELKKLRDSLKSNSQGKLKEIIETGTKQVQEAKAYNEAQINNLEAALKSLIEAGEKKFGLKIKYDSMIDKQIRTTMTNSMVRFDKNGNIDVDHYIETALFASDPVAYVKKIENAVAQRMEAKNLKERTAGVNTVPNAIPSSALGKKKIEGIVNPDDWNMSDSVPLVIKN